MYFQPEALPDGRADGLAVPSDAQGQAVGLCSLQHALRSLLPNEGLLQPEVLSRIPAWIFALGIHREGKLLN